MWSSQQTAPLTLMAGGEEIFYNGMELSLRVTYEIVASNKNRIHGRVVLIGGIKDGTELLEQVLRVQTISFLNPYSAIAIATDTINRELDWIANLTDQEMIDFLNSEIGRPETVITIRGKVIE